LATFCWTRSLLCKDAFKQGFRYLECFQKILHRFQVRKFDSLPAIRTPNCPKHHPSGRRELPVRTFPCVEKLRTAPACIRPDVSTARPDNKCSTKLPNFFPKHRYEKIAATVRTRSSIRQVSHSKSSRSDASQHGPDARASDMEIACIKSTVRTTIPLVRTPEAFIWKLLAAEVRPSGRQGTTVRTRLKNRKKFQRNSREVDHTVVRPDGLCLPSGRCLVFIKLDVHLNPQPINRGP